MPNTLGITQAERIVVKRALGILNTNRPLLSDISTDFSEVPVRLNQIVNSRIRTIPAVGNFGDAAVDVTYTEVPVTLNQLKQVHITFPHTDYMPSERDLIDEQAEPMAIAVSNHIVDAFAGIWVAANFTNSTIQLNGWNYGNTFIPIRNALAGRGVQGKKFLAVNSSVFGALLQDSTLIGFAQNQANGGMITDGVIRTTLGMDVYEYPAIPATGNMVGFAGSPESGVITIRTPYRKIKRMFGFSVACSTYLLRMTLAPVTGFVICSRIPG